MIGVLIVAPISFAAWAIARGYGGTSLPWIDIGILLFGSWRYGW
jgi:hypothetical protein